MYIFFYIYIYTYIHKYLYLFIHLFISSCSSRAGDPFERLGPEDLDRWAEIAVGALGVELWPNH